MNLGVLPHVEAGEVKAEDLDGPDEVGQLPLFEGGAVFRHERGENDGKLRPERVRVVVGLGIRRRRPGRGLTRQRRVGRRQPGVDAGQGAAIGFVRPMFRRVARGFGQPAKLGRHLGQGRGNREFRAESVDLVQVTSQRRRGLAGKGLAHDLRCHEGVAVPVAAHPTVDPEKARRTLAAQDIAPVCVERGQGGQKTPLEIGDGVVDFVGDRDLRRTQQSRAPEDRNLAEQFTLDHLAFRVVCGGGIGLEIVRDGALTVEHALAAHLARMGGDHRGDPGARKQPADVGAGNAFRFERPHGAGKRVRLGVAGARSAMLDLILGQIGDLQKAGEGVGEPNRLLQTQRGQPVLDTPIGAPDLPPMEIDRCFPDRLDLIENGLAVLGADDVPQDATEKPHRRSRLGRLRSHGETGREKCARCAPSVEVTPPSLSDARRRPPDGPLSQVVPRDWDGVLPLTIAPGLLVTVMTAEPGDPGRVWQSFPVMTSA